MAEEVEEKGTERIEHGGGTDREPRSSSQELGVAGGQLRPSRLGGVTLPQGTSVPYLST